MSLLQIPLGKEDYLCIRWFCTCLLLQAITTGVCVAIFFSRLVNGECHECCTYELETLGSVGHSLSKSMHFVHSMPPQKCRHWTWIKFHTKKYPFRSHHDACHSILKLEGTCVRAKHCNFPGNYECPTFFGLEWVSNYLGLCSLTKYKILLAYYRWANAHPGNLLFTSLFHFV